MATTIIGELTAPKATEPPAESANVAGDETASRGGLAGRVGGTARVMLADFLSGWWWPKEVPRPLCRAWAERVPDVADVRGGVWAWRGLVVYRHTIGLAVPALAVAVAGVLAPVVWVMTHPARALLAAVLLFAVLAPEAFVGTALTVVAAGVAVRLFRSGPAPARKPTHVEPTPEPAAQVRRGTQAQ